MLNAFVNAWPGQLRGHAVELTQPAVQQHRSRSASARRVRSTDQHAARMESQRTRRAAHFVAKLAADDLSSLDTTTLADADEAMAKILSAGPAVAGFVPKTYSILQARIDAVKDDTLGRLHSVTDRLPERSRFKGDIVTAVTSPSGLFTSNELLRACGVNKNYGSALKHKWKKKGDTLSHPLYEEKMRGYVSKSRETCSGPEKDAVLQFARGKMAVRSGTHTETFRLEDRKQTLVDDFNFAYPRLLRKVYQFDKTLAGNFQSKKPITIFQRNIRRAVWLAEQTGFAEGEAADRDERKRVKKRLAENWQRGKVCSLSLSLSFSLSLSLSLKLSLIALLLIIFCVLLYSYCVKPSQSSTQLSG